MAIRRRLVGLVITSILVIGIWLLGSVPQAIAETLNFRIFNHVTKAEGFPIADVEGHLIAVSVREGAIVFENGELGWAKGTLVADFIRGTGPADMYSTFTLQDGSTITTHTKGMTQGTPQGAPSAVKFTGDIIHGTGRFQGIKGTMTSLAKILPPEKGEMFGKAVGEITLVYTLPSK